jgi:hypothetical protein
MEGEEEKEGPNKVIIPCGGVRVLDGYKVRRGERDRRMVERERREQGMPNVPDVPT